MRHNNNNNSSSSSSSSRSILQPTLNVDRRVFDTRKQRERAIINILMHHCKITASRVNLAFCVPCPNNLCICRCTVKEERSEAI
mmetsp:Transcript_25482/g.54360  ORF Transcript_25482/g.54360 Transcript_25482/m.54360 type:complete len:84 (+) Transcript_25482:105-356(+)